MRARILFAAFLLAALALTPGAQASSPNQSDLAFLQTLADPVEVPQELPPALGIPEPQMKACTVTQDCQDGNSVTCNGNSSCQSTIAGVKCDGVETRCPNYCSIGMSCQCCNGPYTTVCWSRSGDCQYTGGGIACNGHTITCEQSCPFCPEW
jgi:hypothetical protein